MPVTHFPYSHWFLEPWTTKDWFYAAWWQDFTWCLKTDDNLSFWILSIKYFEFILLKNRTGISLPLRRLCFLSLDIVCSLTRLLVGTDGVWLKTSFLLGTPSRIYLLCSCPPVWDFLLLFCQRISHNTKFEITVYISFYFFLGRTGFSSRFIFEKMQLLFPLVKINRGID